MTSNDVVDMVLDMTGNARNIADYIIETHNELPSENRDFPRSWFEGYVCAAVYFGNITSTENDQLFELMNNLDQLP